MRKQAKSTGDDWQLSPARIWPLLVAVLTLLVTIPFVSAGAVVDFEQSLLLQHI